MKYFNTFLLLFLSAALFLGSCEQSDIREDVRLEDSLSWSGFSWQIKSSEAPIPPGPNPFSSRSEDVYIDSKGRLHMRLAPHDNIWYSTEIYSEEVVGYGTYRWTVLGDIHNLSRNVVLRLFTYDTENYDTEAGSELAFDFSYWGNDTSANNNLRFSVQPISNQDYSIEPAFPERLHNPEFSGEEVLIGKTTHELVWTKDRITWKSFTGNVDNPGEAFASWTFDNTNRPRFITGNAPIVVPEPGEHTNVRMNIWVANLIEPIPAKGEPEEIIFESFEYIPL